MKKTSFKKSKSAHPEYKTINITSIRDSSLSFQARGIMAYLLSKPKNWNSQVYDLIQQSPHGEKFIRAAIKELTEQGYLILRRKPMSNGKFQGTYYEYFETSQTKIIDPIMDEEDYESLKEF